MSAYPTGDFPLPDLTNLSSLTSGVDAEVADYSAGDFTFSSVPRYIKVDAVGVLVVDMLGVGTAITLPVVIGANYERITKIYQSGSDVMTVVGIR